MKLFTSQRDDPKKKGRGVNAAFPLNCDARPGIPTKLWEYKEISFYDESNIDLYHITKRPLLHVYNIYKTIYNFKLPM